MLVHLPVVATTVPEAINLVGLASIASIVSSVLLVVAHLSSPRIVFLGSLLAVPTLAAAWIVLR